MARYDN